MVGAGPEDKGGNEIRRGVRRGGEGGVVSQPRKASRAKVYNVVVARRISGAKTSRQISLITA